MKYILKTITDQILAHAPEAGGESLFRIDGFEDAEVYENIARKVTDTLNKARPELTLNIKLTKNKWEALSNRENSSSIQLLKSNGWVSENESITYYRNLHSSNVLILMGTEDEEDSDGLSNFYAISPATLCRDLRKKYSSVFEDALDFSADDKKVLDRLYKDLFSYVAEDIVKLSRQADSWHGKYDTLQDFISLFYNALPDWGLPPRRSNFPVAKEIQKKGNNLRGEVGFIFRSDFSKLSNSKYKQYEAKIDAYDGEYRSRADAGELSPFSNYQDLKETLLDFIRGKDVRDNQKKWLDVDFDVVSDILGTKLDSVPKEGKQVIKLSGSPLQAMTTALLYALCYAKRQGLDPVTKVEFEFTEAEIIPSEQYDDDGNRAKSLYETWKNICQNANGVFEFLNRNESWGLDEDSSLTIVQEPYNFFDVNQCAVRTADGTIKEAGANKTYHRITFVINFYQGEEGQYELIHVEKSGKEVLSSFEWSFSMNAPWLYSFRDVLSSDFAYGRQSFVPIGIMKNIKTLLFSKSEEEFFDNYAENTAEYSDIFEAIGIQPSDQDASLVSDFYHLSEGFVGFVKELRENGFYSTLETSSLAARFIEHYNSLGKKLLSTSIPQTSRWILDAFVHAFNLEENMDAICGNTGFEYCIVPAWHPSALQKIRQQKIFFLDGCNEWWRNVREESKIPNNSAIDNEIDQIIELCEIQNVVSVFPKNNDAYFGEIKTFGTFSLYAAKNVQNDNKLRDYIRKDAIFDDDFKKSALTALTSDARMMLDVMNDYVRAFPDAYQHLRVVFINPTNLQPIVSSIYRFVQSYKDKAQNMRLDIQIIVSRENMGGRNYLQFWMDEFFSQDENVNIKTYLTEADEEEVEKKIDGNNDIIFFINFLKVNKLGFLKNTRKYSVCPNECLFPIVYRPTPISSTTLSTRTIELTQHQFTAEYTHTQVVYYRNHMENVLNERYIADREVYTDSNSLRIVRELHKKAYWVACIDSGMDGAILRQDKSHNTEYPVIGFSTGKGSYGQYNVTITTRDEILYTLKNQLKARLNMLFHWNNKDLETASELCIQQAGKLDGISLFSAINQKDYNINEFMAYVLTSLREEVQCENAALKTVIHLDSYKHWFDADETSTDRKTEDDSSSRPDFLILKVDNIENDRIQIHATVVECKIAPVITADVHKKKAVDQAQHGIEVLTALFDPNSQSIKRRYWFAQLYRALTFAQVTFPNTDEQYKLLAGKLSSILDGQFAIDWEGEVLGYWLDLNNDEESVEMNYNGSSIKVINIPQKQIQKLLLNRKDRIDYVDLTQDLREDEDQIEEERANREKVIHADICSTFDPELVENQMIPTSDEGENTKVPFQNPNSGNDSDVDEQEARSKMEEVGSGQQESKGPQWEDGHNPQEDENNEGSESRDGDDNNDVVYPHNDEDSSATGQKEEEGEKGSYSGNFKDARVLVGKNHYGKDVYWEYGHAKLANRHLLITGTSGQGKSYAIQCLLYELSKLNVSAVIFDYTEGFRMDQMEQKFRDRMGDKIHQDIIYVNGVPINPFKRQMIDVAGEKMLEKPADVATRIATIFKHVYAFGDQQFAAIYEATMKGLQDYGEHMDWDKFRMELEADVLTKKFPQAKAASSKMTPFLDSVTFNMDQDFDWGKILYSRESSIYIFQLTNFTRPIQVIITEMMLWDMWYFAAREGSKDKPFAVVLDEAQNISHRENSPSAKILTEGRKFGWSAWYATQSLNVLSDDEVTRLSQASFKMYFKPTESEVSKVAKLLDSTSPSNYVNAVQNLNKGQCIVQGEQRLMDGRLGPTKAIVTSITPLDERN